jgi:Tol biopolymer transport system component
MRRRRYAASFLVAATLTATLAAPVAAADPDGLALPARTRSGAPSAEASPTKVRTDRTPQTAPGANGRLAFVQSPFNAFPNALWSMTATGSDARQLTPGGSGWGDIRPSWSPGGTMLAFTRDMTPDEIVIDGDIFVMQADGSGVKRLTATVTNDINPAWTPDGARIVFTSYRTGNGDIYSMKIDGSDVRRLTTSSAVDTFPSVSPNGRKVAFASARAGTTLDIYTMNMDGSGVVRLTTATGDDYAPDWSPDGSQIAFATDRDGNDEIYAMAADGSGQTDLTEDATYDDEEPTWSADGTEIAFWSVADADADIYVMPAAGGTQEAVAPTTDDEWSVDWQPVPAFPLVDARFSTFKGDIEWVFDEGITKGCSAERYCPTVAVTREQMAIFLDRALALPATTTDYFGDDTGRTGEAAINRVAAAGITSGCAPGKYCPTNVVTRGAMASFLARAFDLPATATDFFTDDDGTTHESNINKVAAAHITSGCSPTTYCPTADVTRGQMAAFLRRALAP